MSEITVKMSVEINGERDEFKWRDGNVVTFAEMMRAVADTIYKPANEKEKDE